MAVPTEKEDITSLSQSPKIIFIEPFYGGSHQLLVDTVIAKLTNYTLVTLPAKKWHWRARCGALMLLNLIPPITSEKILFCSSVLNLAELLGVRPDLHTLKKIIYFHENQLIYPVREIKERDIQYAYNQITTCLAADKVLFNSEFNKNTFLENIKKIIKIFPDWRPDNLKEKIAPKCQVLYFPIEYPLISQTDRSSSLLHIVWPHRWEFDKGPEHFFSVLFRLKDDNIPFKVSILGESFTDNPEIFSTAKDYLKEEIINFGFVESKTKYFQVLASAHVVVSTAKHEFFGVAIPEYGMETWRVVWYPPQLPIFHSLLWLEAVYCGCYPLAPNSLVYPEIYPSECLFSNLEELYARLKDFCLSPLSVKDSKEKINIDFERYSSANFISDFINIINNL